MTTALLTVFALALGSVLVLVLLKLRWEQKARREGFGHYDAARERERGSIDAFMRGEERRANARRSRALSRGR